MKLPLLIAALSLVFCIWIKQGESTAESYRRLIHLDCIQQRCEINEDSLRFVIFGDWGGLGIWPYASYQQTEMAKRLASVVAGSKAHMVISTGDNFYTTGVTDVNDHRFEGTFEDQYKDESLMYIPWYIVAGNHDHYGNVSAQIAYTKKTLLKRWKFPDFYYTAKYRISPSITVDFIFLDTVIMCGNTRYDALLQKFVLGEGDDQPSVPPDPIKSAYHWKWLERQLNASTADYLFVVGHFPVYSIGSHGPTNCLVSRLQPLLNKYNVTAYIAGHDHTLQHLRTRGANGHKVDHVISGMGAYTDDNTSNRNKVPLGSSIYFYPKTSWFGKIGLAAGGLVHAKVKKHRTIFWFVNGDGKLLHEFSARPRNYTSN